LEPNQKVKEGGYGYNLTSKTGSIPYMAPEVALGKPYGREADVFSFSILLWEMLALDWAFNGYDTKEYFLRVCARNERLSIPKSWPVIIRTILAEAWDKDPQKRPNMKRIGTLIRGDLEDMTTDATVTNRTEHMMNRSRRSSHFMMDGSRHMKSALGERRARESFIPVGGDVTGNVEL
jgi:serine/threonine protein kinase